MKILIIYHSACADGTFAAAITGLAYKYDAHYLPLNYAGNGVPICDKNGVLVENLVGNYDKVIFVDFSLPEEQQADVAQVMKGKEVVVLDHHDTRSLDEYKRLCAEKDVPAQHVVFASNMSGALLTYFHHIPMFRQLDLNLDSLAVVASLVSDRDTFVRTNLRAIAFYEGCAPDIYSQPDEYGAIYKTLPPTVAKARAIIEQNEVEQIIRDGYEALDRRDEMFRPILAREKPVTTSDVDALHFAVESHRGIRSDLLHALMDSSNVGLAMGYSFSDDRSTVFCSWRSKDGAVPNAQHCANLYDGNGHPNAAGCKMEYRTFASLYPHLV